MWKGTFDQEYEFKGKHITTLDMTTTIDCNKKIKRNYPTLDGKLQLVRKQDSHDPKQDSCDSNYQGWYYVRYELDQEKEQWEYLRFTSSYAELEVHHFCIDKAERSSSQKKIPPEDYRCNNRSPLGSPNYCCSSRSKNRPAPLCEKGTFKTKGKSRKDFFTTSM